MPATTRLQKQRLAQANDAALDQPDNQTYSTFGYDTTGPQAVRSDSVDCTDTDEDPNGACEDENLDPVPSPVVAMRTHQNSEQSERQRIFYNHLAAVNGVVIPSKLAPGEAPIPKGDKGGDRKYECSICGGFYKRRYHVQSHFASCVETNGNPTGARWDDACPGRASRAHYGRANVSAPQVFHTQSLQPGSSKTAITRFKVPKKLNFPLKGSQHNGPQSAFSTSDGFETDQSDFDYPPSSVLSSPSNDLGSWTNGAVLSMVEAWHQIHNGLEGLSTQDPDFQQGMKELEYRNMVDADWTWIVDLEKVNTELTRTTISHPMAL